MLLDLSTQWFSRKELHFLKVICFFPHLFCVSRFQEAEDDCTEALDLDDRYIKAYSRRATARKELGKIKESMEGVLILDHFSCLLTTYVTFWFWIHWVWNLLITDAEFALRLEPNNQEIKKQYADAKSLYEKVSTSLFPVLLYDLLFLMNMH